MNTMAISYEEASQVHPAVVAATPVASVEDRICELINIKNNQRQMSATDIAKFAINLYKVMTEDADEASLEAAAPQGQKPEWKGERAPSDPFCDPEEAIHPDGIICLENGRKFKMLRRHLRETYNMSPEEYRAKWGLRDDYPMTAPNFSAMKSNTAKRNGLGQHAR